MLEYQRFCHFFLSCPDYMLQRKLEYVWIFIWEQSQQLNKKEKKKSTNIKHFLYIERFTQSGNNDKNDDDVNHWIRMFKQFSSPSTAEQERRTRRLSFYHFCLCYYCNCRWFELDESPTCINIIYKRYLPFKKKRKLI